MAIHSLVALLFLSYSRWAAGSPQAAITPVTGGGQFLASAVPELSGSASGAASGDCGGCYVVADVAGVVWYSAAFVNEATAMVSVGVGNGTRQVRTTVVENMDQVTIMPGNLDGAVLQTVDYESSTVINGVPLVSPTPYNLFTAYAVTSAVLQNGVCVTVSGAKTTLPTAYSEALTTSAGRVVLDANGEQAFIDSLGFKTCSAGGASYNPSVLIPVKSSTTTSTRSYSSNVPLVAATAPSRSSVSPPSVSAPVIVLGNQTLTPNVNPMGLPTLGSNKSIIATTAIVPTRNFSSPSIVPFVNQAPNRPTGYRAFFTAWSIGLVGVGAGLYFL